MTDDVIAGRYRLVQLLGSGAMASVWLAEDSELQRQVALKILRPDADRARFQREARAVASLSHPHVCRLYDFGETERGPFIVLEHLPGGSLGDRLHSGRPLPDDDTRRIAAEVAEGLAHAHEHGLVHRDLKPANVLFDGEGRAKIADFGIVRLTDAASLTEPGAILGTAAYLSPEQAGGEPVTPATDVYSFGVILFQMLTGRIPFESGTAVDLARRHRSEPPPPVSAHRRDAPADLAALTAAALAKDPAARPRDGAALVAELSGDAPTGALSDLPLDGPPTLVIPRARPRPRTARKSVIVGAAVPLLLAGGVALAFVWTRGASDNPGTAPSQPSLPSLSSIVSTAPATTLEMTEPATEPETTLETTTEPETTLPTTIEPGPTTEPLPTTGPEPTTDTVPTTEPPPTTDPGTTAPPETTTPAGTTTAGTVAP